ncbi:MAG: hypothetical protein HKN23_05645 [Verrucomicrobiales bacterium]|nr:hypothetical protein [Verrucomicrobiales bacterium]
MTTTIVGLLIVAIACLVSGFETELTLLTLALAFWRAIELVSDVSYGQFQQDERLDFIGKSKLFRSVIFFGLVAAILAFTDDLLFASSGLFAGGLAMFLAFDVPKLRRLLDGHGEKISELRWKWPVIRDLIWKALPLGLLIGVATLEVSAPRLFLKPLHGDRIVGIFSAMAATTIVIQTVVIAVNQASLTPMAKAYAAGNFRRFRRKLKQLLLFGIAVAAAGLAGGWLLGDLFLELAFQSEHAKHLDIFLLLLSAFGLQIFAQAFQIGARAMRQNWWPLFVRTASFLVLAGMCWWLIPGGGMKGAAIACLVGSAFSALAYSIAGCFAFAKKRFPPPVENV